jgi:hypothetical protein
MQIDNLNVKSKVLLVIGVVVLNLLYITNSSNICPKFEQKVIYLRMGRVFSHHY